MANKMEISLDDIIAQNRRAKAAETANAIMGKERNNSSSESSGAVPTGPARMAGRNVSVGKRIASGSGIGNGPAPAAQMNGKWVHDLHYKNNPNASRVSKLPTTLSPAIARSLQNNRLFAALHGNPAGSASPMNVVSAPSGPRNDRNSRSSSGGLNIRGSSGVSIRGLAGPYVVTAANFAPGTTADDVKHAMMPLGKILSCIILSAAPIVICEIVFEKKEAADLCISQYNNQLADGRLLQLYMKKGPPVSRVLHNNNRPSLPPMNPNVQRIEADRRRREANISFQDGTLGVTPPPLYSDALVHRGRGFAR